MFCSGLLKTHLLHSLFLLYNELWKQRLCTSHSMHRSRHLRAVTWWRHMFFLFGNESASGWRETRNRQLSNWYLPPVGIRALLNFCQDLSMSRPRPLKVNQEKRETTERATTLHKSHFSPLFFLAFSSFPSAYVFPSLLFSQCSLSLSHSPRLSHALSCTCVLSSPRSFLYSGSLLAGVDLATLRWSHARVLSAWPLGLISTL